MTFKDFIIGLLGIPILVFIMACASMPFTILINIFSSLY